MAAAFFWSSYVNTFIYILAGLGFGYLMDLLFRRPRDKRHRGPLPMKFYNVAVQVAQGVFKQVKSVAASSFDLEKDSYVFLGSRGELIAAFPSEGTFVYCLGSTDEAPIQQRDAA